VIARAVSDYWYIVLADAFMRCSCTCVWLYPPSSVRSTAAFVSPSLCCFVHLCPSPTISDPTHPQGCKSRTTASFGADRENDAPSPSAGVALPVHVVSRRADTDCSAFAKCLPRSVRTHDVAKSSILAAPREFACPPCGSLGRVTAISTQAARPRYVAASRGLGSRWVHPRQHRLGPHAHALGSACRPWETERPAGLAITPKLPGVYRAAKLRRFSGCRRRAWRCPPRLAAPHSFSRQYMVRPPAAHNGTLLGTDAVVLRMHCGQHVYARQRWSGPFHTVMANEWRADADAGICHRNISLGPSQICLIADGRSGVHVPGHAACSLGELLEQFGRW
jgi:hypothetical protein